VPAQPNRARPEGCAPGCQRCAFLLRPDRLGGIQTTESRQVIRESASLLKRELVLFFALSYAIAWVFFGALALSRAGLGWLPFALSLPVMTVAGSFAPSLAAFITLRITQRRWPRSGASAQAARSPWCAIQKSFTLKAAIVSAVVAPLLIAAAFAIMPAVLLTKGSPSALHWSILLSPSVFSVSTLIGGPLGEEPGWRGFALPRLQVLLGPASASILLGILWAAWHLPLFLTKAWTSSSFPDYALIVTGLAFLMTLLFNLSGESVVAAIAGHAFFNTARWLGGLLNGANLRDKPSPELVLGLCGWGAALLLLAVTRGQLAYRRSGRI
jgi:membrane protease YdiL (CAAX protease family)